MVRKGGAEPEPEPAWHWPHGFTYLLEADVGDVAQHALHRVGPLPLAQRVLLGPDHVQVVGDVVGAVVPRLPLTFALEPGGDVVWRPRVSCTVSLLLFIFHHN